MRLSYRTSLSVVVGQDSETGLKKHLEEHLVTYEYVSETLSEAFAMALIGSHPTPCLLPLKMKVIATTSACSFSEDECNQTQTNGLRSLHMHISLIIHKPSLSF